MAAPSRLLYWRQKIKSVTSVNKTSQIKVRSSIHLLNSSELMVTSVTKRNMDFTLKYRINFALGMDCIYKPYNPLNRRGVNTFSASPPVLLKGRSRYLPGVIVSTVSHTALAAWRAWEVFPDPRNQKRRNLITNAATK
jgi:hypothetical protein